MAADCPLATVPNCIALLQEASLTSIGLTLPDRVPPSLSSDIDCDAAAALRINTIPARATTGMSILLLGSFDKNFLAC